MLPDGHTWGEGRWKALSVNPWPCGVSWTKLTGLLTGLTGCLKGPQCVGSHLRWLVVVVCM